MVGTRRRLLGRQPCALPCLPGGLLSSGSGASSGVGEGTLAAVALWRLEVSTGLCLAGPQAVDRCHCEKTREAWRGVSAGRGGQPARRWPLRLRPTIAIARPAMRLVGSEISDGLGSVSVSLFGP